MQINSRDIILRTISTLFLFFIVPCLYSNPTLLQKKAEKKEKLREEELVIKDVKVEELIINQYINLKLVKSIFPEATSYGKIDEKTFSIPIYMNDEEIGFLFETFDVTRGLGYSRRPFHLAVGVDTKGILRNVKLLKHVEPIAILGRTDEDFIRYLKQYKDIDLRSGISLTLELTGADIEGDNVAMRETAGDTDSLTQIDGVSRTTTSSLLFMDAIMRGARKIARQKNILLDENDLGNFVDLELYKPQTWSNLLGDKSLAALKITIKDIQEKFASQTVDGPRKLRFANPEENFGTLYFTAMSPAGIGINILGRRWFDQYISAGRNVDDQVFYLAFEGELWRNEENRITNIINNQNLIIKQDNNEIIVTKDLFKELPFNHAKKAPNIAGQGLLYFSSKFMLNPHEPVEIIYKIMNDDKEKIEFNLKYKLPELYYLSTFRSIKTKNVETFSLLNIFSQNKLESITSIITILIVLSVFVFSNRITKNRKLFSYFRIFMLFWVSMVIGFYLGGQISIIHLVNLFKSIFLGGGSLLTFFIEPIIFLFGITTIISLFFWGRALFCGWLCPFGALQELLSTISKKIGIRQKSFKQQFDHYFRYVKYILLAIIFSFSFIEMSIANIFYNIEPFKTAITLRFMAPASAVIWASFLLIICLFIERFFCRYLCPLGAGLGLLGKIRILDFLKRRKECGNPCIACNKVCPTGAIKPSGKIIMSECLGCLDCQVMYSDYKKCPPLVAIAKAKHSIS